MEILTLKEAAKFFRVSERTIQRRMKEGLPYHQIWQGKITFRKRTLECWYLKYEKTIFNSELETKGKMKILKQRGGDILWKE